MDLYKKREVRWAYGFDQMGYYTGRVLRQESPLEPGVFLMPAGATSVEPPFREHFRARWDGNAWNLEAVEAAAREATKHEFFADVLESKQNEIIDRIVKSAADIVASSVLRELRAQMQHDLDLCREQFTGHAQVLLDATERKVSSLESQLREKNFELNGQQKSLSDKIEYVRDYIDDALGHMSALRVECQEALSGVREHSARADAAANRAENADAESSRALAEVKEPGFWARLMGKS